MLLILALEVKPGFTNYQSRGISQTNMEKIQSSQKISNYQLQCRPIEDGSVVPNPLKIFLKRVVNLHIFFSNFS